MLENLVDSTWGLFFTNKFYLTADAEGFHFESASGVSVEKQQELLGTTYPTADAAEFAATGDVIDSDEITVQHAVGICTHFDNVISFGSGQRRHLTNFLRHEDGRHYTQTKHQRNTLFGWRTTDKFNYSVRRSFCGCN